MVSALALGVAFGLGGQAWAQDAVPANLHFHVVPLGAAGAAHAVSPSATTALNQGIVAMGTAAPLDGSGLDTWPCFTGGNYPDCLSIPAGGLVVGIPYQNWSLSACTSTGCGGQIYYTFEDDSVTGVLIVSITVSQAGGTILSTGYANLGVVQGAPGSIWIVYLDDIAFPSCASGTCATPVAGPAVITATTIIAQSSTSKTAIKGSAVINLE